MREPNSDDIVNLAEALSEAGSISASIIPMMIRVVKKHIKKAMPEACLGHQMAAVNRLVSLALITNGFLIVERTTDDDQVAEVTNQNIALAKDLMRVARAHHEDNEDEAPEPGQTNWLNDDQLKKMFEEAN